MEHSEILRRLEVVGKGEADLISELLLIEHELPYGSKDFVSPTIELLKTYEIDIFEQALAAVQASKDVFRIAELLRALFKDLQSINIPSFLDFLQVYFVKTKNDLVSGRFIDLINEKSKNDDVWASSFEQEILRRKDERLYSSLLSTYLGIVQADFSRGYDKIIKLIKNDDYLLKRTGLRALGLLENIPEGQKSEIVNFLLEYANNSDEVIAANSTFSICKLSQLSKQLEEKKIELSLSGQPAVRYEITNHIWVATYDAKKISSVDLAAIKNICDYDLNYKGITQNLDHLLYQLVSNNHINEVEEILSEWISKHPADIHYQSNFAELFNSAIFEIAKNKDLIKIIATKWMNSNDLRFHHVLSEIFSYMSVRSIKKAEFDLMALADFSYNDHLYIVRKIVGFVLDFDISISLVLSILKLEPLSKDVGDLIASVLIEHIGYNYSHKTLLRIHSEFDSYSESAQGVLRICIKELEKRNDELKSLNRVNELVPNSDHRLRLDKAFQKAMNKSMEEARENSPLLSVISHVGIKEGHSWFSFHHGQYHEPSKMGQFSHGMELPRRDVLDEVGASMERFEFRNAKRGES